MELVRTLIKSSNADINQLNGDEQSPLSLAILYNHEDVAKLILEQEKIRVQLIDLKMAMQMNNYEIVRLLIEKDRSSLRARSATNGDLIIHIYMRINSNNFVCLETLLSFISDSELLTYLSEVTLLHGDNLLHIAGKRRLFVEDFIIVLRYSSERRYSECLDVFPQSFSSEILVLGEYDVN